MRGGRGGGRRGRGGGERGEGQGPPAATEEAIVVVVVEEEEEDEKDEDNDEGGGGGGGGGGDTVAITCILARACSKRAVSEGRDSMEMGKKAPDPPTGTEIEIGGEELEPE